MASTKQTPAPSHLEEGWLRDLVTELSSIERPSASPGEHEAAQWLVRKLSELGVQGWIESSRAHGTYWWPLGIATATGTGAGLAALRGHRLAGVLLGVAAALAAADDMPPRGSRLLRRFLPQGERSQVLAALGPADAERTVVVHAHHDAPRSGFLYSPAIPEKTIGWMSPEQVPDTGPPLMWPVVGAPLAVAAGAALGSRRLIQLGTLVSGGIVGVLGDIASREVVSGANDNATGVVALLALARAIAKRPLDRVRVLLLSTSEEATCDGIAEFARHHFPELPLETTFFLCLETLGSPQLAVLRGEGMLGIRDYPPRALGLLDDLAAELDIALVPNLRTRNATDGCQPLFAGYECAAITSVTELHQLSNYHWPTDTADRVDYGTVADAVRLTEAVVRRLDDRWL